MKRFILAAIYLAWFSVSAHGADLREYAIGDSIAVGLGLPGPAHVGASPKAVLQQIGNMPISLLYGRVVVLSSGVSNDPSQIDYVPLQLAALHAAGAKVILLGVGINTKFAALNTRLTGMAGEAKAGFLWGWYDVHPDDYIELLMNVRRMECVLYKVCEA